ncbi:MAG TPA: hypothetical protein ENN84_07540 [Candidatus Marinimicrobia bacterium]|nr:hypothetical protein [Candidatus Neomarinimicrobiota bacterium]
MLQLMGKLRVYAYRAATDMRKSFNGLRVLVRQELGENPLSGDLFLFLNCLTDQAKLRKK